MSKIHDGKRSPLTGPSPASQPEHAAGVVPVQVTDDAGPLNATSADQHEAGSPAPSGRGGAPRHTAGLAPPSSSSRRPTGSPFEKALQQIERHLDGWTTRAESASIVALLREQPLRDRARLFAELVSRDRAVQLFTDLTHEDRRSVLGLLTAALPHGMATAELARAVVSLSERSNDTGLADQLVRESRAAGHRALPALVVLGRAPNDANNTESSAPDVSERVRRADEAAGAVVRALRQPGGGSGLIELERAQMGDEVAKLLDAEFAWDALLPATRELIVRTPSDPGARRGLALAVRLMLEHDRSRELALLVGPLDADQRTALTKALGVDLGSALRAHLDDAKVPVSAASTTVPTASPASLPSESASSPAVASFGAELAPRLAALEREHGLRVHLLVADVDLDAASLRRQVRDRVSRLEIAAASGLALPSELELRLVDGEVTAEPRDFWTHAPTAEEARDALERARIRLASAGIELAGALPSRVLMREREVRSGTLAAIDFLERHANILKAQRISSVVLGEKTRIVTRAPSADAEPSDDAKSVRVLELDIQDLARKLGRPSAEARARTEGSISRVIGELPKEAQLSAEVGIQVAQQGGNLDRGLTGGLSYQPFPGKQFAVNATFHPSMGPRIGAKKGLELLGAQATAGIGATASGAYGEVDVSRVLFRDRETQVVGGAFGFYNGWFANAGALVYGEHRFREPDTLLENSEARAWASWQLWGGTAVGADLKIGRNAPDTSAYPIVGIDNQILAYAGMGFALDDTSGNAFEVVVGAGGIKVGPERGWKLSVVVPFLAPWRFPWVYFNQFDLADRYRFSYDYLKGTAEVQQLGSRHRNGTSEIPPAALRLLFQRLMATAGVDVRPEEVRRWIDLHGLAPQVAALTEQSRNAPTADARASAKTALDALTTRVSADLMMAEYLQFRTRRELVTESDVQQHFERLRESFTVTRADLLHFGSREEAERAAKRVRSSETLFDELLATQRARPDGAKSSVEFAHGQPGVSRALVHETYRVPVTETTDPIELTPGQFVVARVQSRETPTWEQSSDSLRRELAVGLQSERDQEAFARAFGAYLDEHRDVVLRAVEIERARALAATTTDGDWRTVHAGIEPLVLETDADPAALKLALGRALQTTARGLEAAIARLESFVREAERELSAAGDAGKPIGAAIRSESQRWTSKLGEDLAGLREVAKRSTGATTLDDVRALEADRLRFTKRLQTRLDRLTLGESRFEELLHEAKNLPAAETAAEGLFALKRAPELLALLPIDLDAAQDKLADELERWFYPPTLPMTPSLETQGIEIPEPVPASDQPTGRVLVHEGEPPAPRPRRDAFAPGPPATVPALDALTARARGALDRANAAVSSPAYGQFHRDATATLELVNRATSGERVSGTSPGGSPIQLPPLVASLLGGEAARLLREEPALVRELVDGIQANDARRSLTALLDLVHDEPLQRLFERVDGESLIELLRATSPAQLRDRITRVAAMLTDLETLPARVTQARDDARRMGHALPNTLKDIADDLATLPQRVRLAELEEGVGAIELGSRFQRLQRMLDQLSEQNGTDVTVAAESNLSVGEVLGVLKLVSGGQAHGTGAARSPGWLALLDLPDAQAGAAFTATLFADQLESDDGATSISVRSRQFGFLAMEISGLNSGRELIDTALKQEGALRSAADQVQRDIATARQSFRGVSTQDLGQRLRSSVSSWELPANVQRIGDQVARLGDALDALRENPNLVGDGVSRAVDAAVTTLPRRSNGSVDLVRVPQWFDALPETTRAAFLRDGALSRVAAGIDLGQLASDLRNLGDTRLDTGPLAALASELGSVVDALRGLQGAAADSRRVLDSLSKVIEATRPLTQLSGTVADMTARFGMRMGTEHDVEVRRRIELGERTFLDVGATVGAVEFARNNDPSLLANLMGVDVPVQLHTLAFVGAARLRVTISGAREVGAALEDTRKRFDDLFATLESGAGGLANRTEEVQRELERLTGLSGEALRDMDVPEILRTLDRLRRQTTDALGVLASITHTLSEQVTAVEQSELELRRAIEHLDVQVQNKVTIRTADGLAAHVKHLYARLTKDWDARGGSRGSLQVGAFNVLGTAPGREINLHLEGNSTAADLVWSDAERDVYRDLYALEVYLRGELELGTKTKSPSALQVELRKIMSDTSEASPLGVMLKMRKYFFDKRLVLSPFVATQDVRKGLSPTSIGTTIGANLGPVHVYLGGATNPQTFADPKAAKSASASAGLRFTLWE